jgi:hypothetical protein
MISFSLDLIRGFNGTEGGATTISPFLQGTRRNLEERPSSRSFLATRQPTRCNPEQMVGTMSWELSLFQDGKESDPMKRVCYVMTHRHVTRLLYLISSTLEEQYLI